MGDIHLYRLIAETLRQEILKGKLRPGDSLPPIRKTAVQWGCATGTVERAYRELTHQGLIGGWRRHGTRVAVDAEARQATPLKMARLAHRAEAFLLEALGEGFTATEAERAVLQALDRWHSVTEMMQLSSDNPGEAPEPQPVEPSEAVPPEPSTVDHVLTVCFAGGYGDGSPLARELAEATEDGSGRAGLDDLDASFVRRPLAGQRAALACLVCRHLGLLVAPGNPLGLVGIEDLAKPDVRFVDSPRGSGLHSWLDAQLGRLGVPAQAIRGYGSEAEQSEIASAILLGQADAGLGVEKTALDHGLGFVRLVKERYDLMVLADRWNHPSVQWLARFLSTAEVVDAISSLVGYEEAETDAEEQAS